MALTRIANSAFPSAAVQGLPLADSLSARIGSELSYTSFPLAVLREHNGAATTLLHFFLQRCGRGLCRWCCVVTIHDYEKRGWGWETTSFS